MNERLSAALADRYRIERELGAGDMAIVSRRGIVRHCFTDLKRLTSRTKQ